MEGEAGLDPAHIDRNLSIRGADRVGCPLRRLKREFMRVLVAIQGHYGQRIADNIRKYGPAGWKVYTFTFAQDLPV